MPDLVGPVSLLMGREAVEDADQCIGSFLAILQLRIRALDVLHNG